VVNASAGKIDADYPRASAVQASAWQAMRDGWALKNQTAARQAT